MRVPPDIDAAVAGWAVSVFGSLLPLPSLPSDMSESEFQGRSGLG